MVQRVADLAERHKISVPGVDRSSMLNDVRLTQVLQPIGARLERAMQLVQDTTMQADTEAWQAFLAYYGVLSSLASRIPDVEGALAPVVDYMKVSKSTPQSRRRLRNAAPLIDVVLRSGRAPLTI